MDLDSPPHVHRSGEDEEGDGAGADVIMTGNDDCADNDLLAMMMTQPESDSQRDRRRTETATAGRSMVPMSRKVGPATVMPPTTDAIQSLEPLERPPRKKRIGGVGVDSVSMVDRGSGGAIPVFHDPRPPEEPTLEPLIFSPFQQLTPVPPLLPSLPHFPPSSPPLSPQNGGAGGRSSPLLSSCVPSGRVASFLYSLTRKILPVAIFGSNRNWRCGGRIGLY